MILSTVNELKLKPKRIISLVPSQTELLHYLELDTETIGITKFCIHPKEWHQNKIKIGGTKTINQKKIQELQPDLIIANKEENVKEQIEALAEHFPIWLTDVNNFEDALKMIFDIGMITDKITEATFLIDQLRKDFEQISTPKTIKRAVYLIWKDPYMTIGGDTFINDMLHKAGVQNMFQNQKRYPEVSIKQIQDSGCEIVLLSSEPYPFKEKHLMELQIQLPNCKIALINGEIFSWYGSRLLKSVAYFNILNTNPI